MREETINTTTLREQVEGLRHMTVGQLKDKYREVFCEGSRSNLADHAGMMIEASRRERKVAADENASAKPAFGGPLPDLGVHRGKPWPPAWKLRAWCWMARSSACL